MSTTERITLPSGAWIQLKDARTLRRGDKKKAMANVNGEGDKLLAMAYEMTDGLLAVLVIDWSYDLPLPSQSLESLDLLPIEDDDALMKAIEPARAVIFPEPANPADPKQIADPASPTEPSAA
ncbi:hypothetical protein ACIO6U_02545 [Streptomyces sp. NPDC087422]|uniref:hypothetical protein n=1 Tax=Streptomyces sp. NPDC087422 TaxID=3365786 RepID=UPI0037F68A89